jgi:hypothetical protein
MKAERTRNDARTKTCGTIAVRLADANDVHSSQEKFVDL